MARLWLMKTEPTVYSFDDLVKDGRTVWDGISNPVALKNMRDMKKKDRVFIYHTGSEKAVVGIAEVTGNPKPPANMADTKLVVVEIKAVKKLKHSVTLHDLKAIKSLSRFELVRLPRLSVMPVPMPVWNLIIRKGL